MSCNGCPLQGSDIVPYTQGRKREIVFVGESPGRQEEDQGKPFVGPAGKLLTRCITNAGLDRNDCHILNSAKCLINKKQMGTKEITQTLACCRTFLEQRIHKIKPKLIVLLGDFALRQVLKKSGITRRREEGLTWSKEFNCHVLPTFHPAYILRNPPFEVYLQADLKYVKKLKDRGWNPEPKNKQAISYKTVNSLEPIFTAAEAKSIYVGLDTETQGMDPWDPNCFVISYSVAASNTAGYQVVLYEKCKRNQADFFVHSNTLKGKGGVKLRIPVKKAPYFYQKIRHLRLILEHDNIKLIMQNGNYDLLHLNHLFDKLGKPRPKVRRYVMDIQAAAQILEENLYRQASLATLQRAFSKRETDWKAVAQQDMDKSNMILAPADRLAKYAVEDAIVTREVGLNLIAKIKKEPALLRYFTKMVMPVIQKGLLGLTDRGALIDKDALPEIETALELETNQAHHDTLRLIPKAVIFDHHGKKLSLTRAALVKDCLFGKRGFNLPVLSKTKGGQPSIDKDARTQLKDKVNNPRALKFIQAYEEWAGWNSLLHHSFSQIVTGIRSDGRVHSSYSLTTAVTGRVASSSPNMQNIPKRSEQAKYIRRLITTKTGYTLLEADFSQAELRWLAHLTQDRALLRVYRDGGDIHTNTAMSFYKGSWENMNDAERKKARLYSKGSNFGMVYMISAVGFQQYMRTQFDISITVRQAEEMMRLFYATYPGIVKYWRRAIDFCRKHGYISTPLGRRRHLPQVGMLDRESRWAREEAERQCVNSPIQGAASDTTLLTLVNCAGDRKLQKLKCDPILFIHDSIIFEVPKKHHKTAAKRVKEIMENPPLHIFNIKFAVPMVVDVKTGPNLAEMKSLDF